MDDFRKLRRAHFDHLESQAQREVEEKIQRLGDEAWIAMDYAVKYARLKGHYDALLHEWEIAVNEFDFHTIPAAFKEPIVPTFLGTLKENCNYVIHVCRAVKKGYSHLHVLYSKNKGK